MMKIHLLLATFFASAVLGNSPAAPLDNELVGKVVVGYQGWFAPKGDGSGFTWVHYGGERFGPGWATFEMWPDLSEFTAEEKFPTPFRFASGEVASVFSAANAATVERHFRWMREYGIDGAALQRFGTNLSSPEELAWRDKVLDNCRQAAAANGRIWFVMYDLSGLTERNIYERITDDWKRLIDQDDFRKDAGYTRHHGKPLVSLWGIGFDEKRKYSIAACKRLIEFFKNDPKYGGNAVMEGVPYHWRKGVADSEPVEKSHEVYAMADVLSPWAVGRYGSLPDAQEIGPKTIAPDLAWCAERGITYLPVVFPGFSWQNLEKTRGRESRMNHIPREGGRFLWDQAVSAIKSGAGAIYVAMFDEIDEGTAIFKVTNTPPVGESTFLTYEGLPSDHYLWLVGEIGRALHQPAGQLDFQLPKRLSESGADAGTKSK